MHICVRKARSRQQKKVTRKKRSLPRILVVVLEVGRLLHIMLVVMVHAIRRMVLGSLMVLHAKVIALGVLLLIQVGSEKSVRHPNDMEGMTLKGKKKISGQLTWCCTGIGVLYPNCEVCQGWPTCWCCCTGWGCA